MNGKKGRLASSQKLMAEHFYHFYNRGVNREPIFFGKDNWRFFIRKMRQYFQPDLVAVLAYCLMPNHYHLLVYVRCDDISRKVMQPFGTSYVKAVNKQQNRVGPLFQGAFKHKLIDNPAYLAHLTRYIHLNPVQAGLVEQPADWPYSSYSDYIGLRQGTLPAMDLVLSEFASQDDYRHFVESAHDPMDPAMRDTFRRNALMVE